MTRPWQVLDKVPTAEGVLELRQRGDHDFLIVIGGRVLMNSYSRSSEEELARLACAPLAKARAPRVLVAGLGMGFTLRAALDVLPLDARVTVCEINKVVVEWCRGPLAAPTRDALADRRVHLALADVAGVIAKAAPGSFDALVLDLYEGPNAASQRRDDPFYSDRALAEQWRALAPGGVLAVWSEDADVPYSKRIKSAGFDVATHSIGSGGRRHIVYLGTRVEVPVARGERGRRGDARTGADARGGSGDSRGDRANNPRGDRANNPRGDRGSHPRGDRANDSRGDRGGQRGSGPAPTSAQHRRPRGRP